MVCIIYKFRQIVLVTQPLDKNRVPSQQRGHNPWLVCEVALRLQGQSFVGHKLECLKWKVNDQIRPPKDPPATLTSFMILKVSQRPQRRR